MLSKAAGGKPKHIKKTTTEMGEKKLFKAFGVKGWKQKDKDYRLPP